MCSVVEKVFQRAGSQRQTFAGAVWPRLDVTDIVCQLCVTFHSGKSTISALVYEGHTSTVLPVRHVWSRTTVTMFSSLTNRVIKETYKCTWKKKHLLLWCTVHRLDHCRTSTSLIISCNEIFGGFFCLSDYFIAAAITPFYLWALTLQPRGSRSCLPNALCLIQHVFTSSGKGFI